MKIFHCGHCDMLVFFENTKCVNCGHKLAYLPDLTDMSALVPKADGLCKSLSAGAGGKDYRLCSNYSIQGVCNWAIPADDPNPLCRSCRVTPVIPDLSKPGTKALWAALEAAKRRLIYTLLCLDLPVVSKTEDPERGLAFEFLADPDDPKAPRVLTGHDNGLITINIAEADDAERETRRHAMNEEYRTLLGHFRHEVGHYYWDRLIKDSPHLDEFRKLFGDDRVDYGEALKRHHQNGAPADWRASFVSAYASSHPWEDWAETWAHYLHMTDTLETATVSGLSLRPMRPADPVLKADVADSGNLAAPFDRLIERWFPLTFVLNNLNRGMGLPDAYPFVLPSPAIEKLRFVHEVIGGETLGRPEGRPQGNARPELFKRLGVLSGAGR